MRILFKIADYLSHLILITFMLTVITSAIVSSLGKYYLPHINEYAPNVISFLNKRSAYLEFSLQSAHGDWAPFEPQLTLQGLEVKDKRIGETVFSARDISIELNFLKSIVTTELYFESIIVNGLHVSIHKRDENHRGMAFGKEDLRDLLESLWAIGQVEIKSFELSVINLEGKSFMVNDLYIKQSTQGSYKQVSVWSGEKSPYKLSLDANLEGSFLTEPANGQAYFMLSGLKLQELNEILGLSLKFDGDVNTGIWVNWQGVDLDASGYVSSDSQLVLKNEQTWKIEPFRMDFFAGASNKSIYAAFPEINLVLNQKPIKLKQAFLQKNDQLSFSVNKIELSEVVEYLKEFPLPEKLSEVILDLDPRGGLKKASLLFDEKEFWFQGELVDVEVSPWKGAPGINHIDGYLFLDKAGGFVEFKSDALDLFFPKLYEKPIPLDNVTGEVAWEIERDEIYVFSNILDVSLFEARTAAEFDLYLPRKSSEENPPRLHLSVGLQNGKASYRDYLIPKTLPENLQNWLEQNIIAGQVNQASFIFRGHVRNGYDEPREIQLWLDLEEAEISYQDQWPHVHSIDGEFYLDQLNSFAIVDSALIKNINLKNVRLDISNENNQSGLAIKTKIDTSSSNVLDLLKNEGFSSLTNGLVESWRSASGRVKSDFLLTLDLKQPKDSLNIIIDSKVEDLDLKLPSYDLSFENLNGPVRYELATGFSSSGLSGEFWGEEMNISLQNDGKQFNTIKMEGKLKAEALQSWAKRPAFHFFKGEANALATLQFGEGSASLEIDSMLNGVAIGLPEPFFKPLAEERELKLFLPLSSQDSEMTVKLGDIVNAKFLLGEVGIQAGKFNLGFASADYKDKTVVVDGQLQRVDFEEWMNVVNQYEKYTQLYFNDEKEDSWTISIKNLRVKSLMAFGKEIDTVSLSLFDTSAFWQFGLSQKDISAEIRVFHENDLPIEARILRINLAALAEPDKEQEQEQEQEQDSGQGQEQQADSEIDLGFADPKLSGLPDIDFVVDKLLWDEEDYGGWEFQLRTTEDRIALENIRGSVRHLQVNAIDEMTSRIEWTLGENPRTAFTGYFFTENLADALLAWGYQQEVNSRFSSFIVESNWEGTIVDFDFLKNQSDLTLLLDKGNFASLQSSSTDALKFIGILNLSNLLKRIQLDFRDLTDKGLAYDSVSGRVKLDNGKLDIVEPIVIDGSSSTIRFSGTADLIFEELDLTMGVTIPIASNLSWVVGLAAGLPAALGVYIVSKLLKKQVDKLSSAIYSVKGPFDDPKIKFIKLFEDEVAPAVSYEDLPLEKAEVDSENHQGSSETQEDESGD